MSNLKWLLKRYVIHSNFSRPSVLFYSLFAFDKKNLVYSIETRSTIFASPRYAATSIKDDKDWQIFDNWQNNYSRFMAHQSHQTCKTMEFLYYVLTGKVLHFEKYFIEDPDIDSYLLFEYSLHTIKMDCIGIKYEDLPESFTKDFRRCDLIIDSKFAEVVANFLNVWFSESKN